MKRVISVILCLLLMAALAIPAFAAGTASFSMAASGSSFHRGDTVTVTVSVSCSVPATSYGFMLSYDSSAFELVNGSCTVGGTLVSSFNNGFAFMFQTATAYSGTVGTVTFKVKENADLANYRISGSASVMNGSTPVDASGSSVTVAISCVHNYGSWTKVNDTVHERSCSLCSGDETVNHTWGSGAVTKQPTCKDEGIKTYTCTACSATKTQSIAKTTDHNYGNWTKVNDTTHKRTCSLCSKEETADHTWGSGAVTRKPTCKEEGVKTYTCTACSATRTQRIAKTAHTYDHACDTDCNACGFNRTTTHSYKASWGKDEKHHWHECSVCKDRKDTAPHTPGAEATQSAPQTCTACGYVIQAALGHQHSYAATWTTDEAGHWYPCSGCEDKDSYAAHEFENVCDKDCSVCGYTRETEHRLAETWTADAINHWRVCSGCGLKQEEAAHQLGAEATAEAAQTCTVCGYEIAPALGAEEAAEPTEAMDAAAPTEAVNVTTATEAMDAAVPTEVMEATTATDSAAQKASPENKSPVWIILAAVIAAIGIAFVFVVMKKKTA